MRLVTPLQLTSLLLTAVTLGACSGDSATGSSSSGVEIGFQLDSVVVPESIGLVIATVLLSESRAEDTSVNFVALSPPFPTPVATFNLDFQVITLSPVLIPAGSVSTNVTIVILNDGDGELDEGFVLRIVSAPGADVGVNNDFFVTIQDDDAIPFPENEPNDPEPLAEDVGPIDVNLAYRITGTIDAAAVDFFRLTAGAATDVWIELTPLSSGPDVVLTIRDPAGTTDLAGPVDENGPGESENLLYPAAAGETFLIEVFNSFTGGLYRLKVVGLGPVNPLAPPTEAVRTGVWIVNTETGEIVRIEDTFLEERAEPE